MQPNNMDLTRFDFHVVRFMNSESVERMSPTEIGQYLLLLCKSWLSNKDASLPDDLRYMAIAARSESLSELVISMFPIVDTPWGKRRRNETLYGEFLMAVERSGSARERGARRWDAVRNADSIAVGITDGNAVSHAQSIIPINHTNQNINIESGSFNQGNYSNIRTHWYRHFKKNLSTSKRNKEQYATACSAYDEDRVLEYLETWATDNPWVSAHPKGDNRLYVFLAALPSMIAGDQMRREQKTGVPEDIIKATWAAEDERARKENEEFLEKTQREEAEAELTRGQI